MNVMNSTVTPVCNGQKNGSGLGTRLDENPIHSYSLMSFLPMYMYACSHNNITRNIDKNDREWPMDEAR